MKIPSFPEQVEIQQTLDAVEEKLKDKALNRWQNKPTKEGLQDCTRLLQNRIANPDNPYFVPETEEELERIGVIYRKQLAGIQDLETQRGRSIAVWCVDYLNGQTTAEEFLNLVEKTINRR